MSEPNDGLVQPNEMNIEEVMNFEISTETTATSNFLIPKQPKVTNKKRRPKWKWDRPAKDSLKREKTDDVVRSDEGTTENSASSKNDGESSSFNNDDDLKQSVL